VEEFLTFSRLVMSIVW